MIFCVLCWRWPGRLFGVLNILDLPPCARRQKHFPCRGDGPVCCPELWRWWVCELWLTRFLRRLWTLGPEDSNLVCGEACFCARTSHHVLNWNFYHAAVATNRHGPAQTVWPVVGWETCTSSQPTCLYYIVLTKSLCLAHNPLFLYSAGEILLVYVFDICTNAPLWKRKWNLDISVIISLPLFSFTASWHLTIKKLLIISPILGVNMCRTAPPGVL